MQVPQGVKGALEGEADRAPHPQPMEGGSGMEGDFLMQNQMEHGQGRGLLPALSEPCRKAAHNQGRPLS